MCSGNSIKAKAGDSTDCGTDPPCDGFRGVPNDQHSECGLYFLSVFLTVGGTLYCSNDPPCDGVTQ